jgi:3-carboxy-cis,cis-muconate cycloisomerase
MASTSFSPTDSSLFAPLFSHPKMAAIFADGHYIRCLLQVEAALAQVQGRLGVIPAAAATEIAAAVATFQPDRAQLQAGLERAGVPVPELVKQLRVHVGQPSADFLHWGATSQDIVDTALIIQIRSALGLIEAALRQVIRRLSRLAVRHRRTLMAGRTHSQQALPIPFGLKIAGWLVPLLRHLDRLAQLKRRLLVVQFGGAAGTLAALGEAGPAVRHALAAELNLGVLPIPWHTQRDNLAELAGWLSLVCGTLAKMAQDIILMAQSEVGELRESADPDRGGSSTMPQKSNPVISELIIAAARSNAALLSAMHQALVQEQERATHGWQLEWLTLPQMFGLTAAAVNKAALLAGHMVVDVDRMRQNVAAGQGLMLAEAITFALAPLHMSRDKASRLVKEACRLALRQQRHLIDVMQEQTDAPLDWLALRDETAYFGSADHFIDQVLQQAFSLEPELRPLLRPQEATAESGSP